MSNNQSIEYTTLVERAIKGDSGAFHEIYSQRFNDLYYIALSMLRNPHDAEDATQNTFIKAWQSIGSLSSPYAFKGWIVQILRNNCMDMMRKNKPILAKDEDMSFEETLYEDNVEFLPADILEKKETQRLVREIVDNLPDTQRETVILHYYEQMSIRELADVMSLSEGAIKSRLFYGRQAIKEGVERHEKQGVKLYSITGLPLIAYILREGALEISFAPEIIAGFWTSASASMGISAATTSSSGIVASFTALSSTVKTAIIGGTATALVLAGGIGVWLLSDNVEVPSVEPENVQTQQQTPDIFDNSINIGDLFQDRQSTDADEYIEVPHPFAKALEEFFEDAVGFTFACLVDINHDGIYEMIAVKRNSDIEGAWFSHEELKGVENVQFFYIYEGEILTYGFATIYANPYEEPYHRALAISLKGYLMEDCYYLGETTIVEKILVINNGSIEEELTLSLRFSWPGSNKYYYNNEEITEEKHKEYQTIYTGTYEERNHIQYKECGHYDHPEATDTQHGFWCHRWYNRKDMIDETDIILAMTERVPVSG